MNALFLRCLNGAKFEIWKADFFFNLLEPILFGVKILSFFIA